MSYYFAYGSNMNSQRMAARDMRVVGQCAGWLDGYGLRFNKRSGHDARLACANIIFARDERVEGVLYQLESSVEIARLDPFEGTPFRYSRERFPVQTERGVVPAWVYIANPAVIDHCIRPARWYIEHLLAGSDYLSPAYWERIDNTACCEGVTIVW